MRNYNTAFIEGSKNLRASSFKEHVATEMHKTAIVLVKRQQSSNNSPIARALYNIGAVSETMIKSKFDIEYFITKEILLL